MDSLLKEKLRKRWYAIKYRCENPKDKCYCYYGGKGISVLWNSKEEFFNDMSDSFVKHVEEHGIKNTTIDRIDSDGNYSKDNCRWATLQQQADNKKRNTIINGKTISQISKDLGGTKDLVNNRIKAGWDVEKAISTPPRTLKGGAISNDMTP